MYKKLDHRAVIAALVFLGGLIFLVVAGAGSAQQVVEPTQDDGVGVIPSVASDR